MDQSRGCWGQGCVFQQARARTLRGRGSGGASQGGLPKAGVRREGGDCSGHTKQGGACSGPPRLLWSLRRRHCGQTPAQSPRAVAPAISGHGPGRMRLGLWIPAGIPALPHGSCFGPEWNRAQPGGPNVPQGRSWTPTDPLTVSVALRMWVDRLPTATRQTQASGGAWAAPNHRDGNRRLGAEVSRAVFRGHVRRPSLQWVIGQWLSRRAAPGDPSGVCGGRESQTPASFRRPGRGTQQRTATDRLSLGSDTAHSVTVTVIGQESNQSQ